MFLIFHYFSDGIWYKEMSVRKISWEQKTLAQSCLTLLPQTLDPHSHFSSVSSEAIEDGEGKKVDDIKEESEKNRAKEKIKTTEN